MAKFKSTESGPVTVVTPRGQFLVGGGGEIETDDPDVIAAFRQNPSLEEQSGKPAARKQDKQDKPTAAAPKSKK